MQYYFITGTSRGIGQALAQEALSKNAKVIGMSRGKSIENKNYEHIPINFSDLESIYAFEFPKLNGTTKLVLINNAGSLGQVAPVGENEDVEITKPFTINTIAASILMNKFLKAYKELAVEKIVLNVSSGAARHAIESWSSYCASKAALDMYSQVAAVEQGKYFANPAYIFSVAPGIVDTQMQTEIRSVSDDKFKDVTRFKNYKANGELSLPENTAKLIFKIIENPKEYKEVLLDVRNL
jgi:benzil reductase ((S)-benzoin forming)